MDDLAVTDGHMPALDEVVGQDHRSLHHQIEVGHRRPLSSSQREERVDIVHRRCRDEGGERIGTGKVAIQRLDLGGKQAVLAIEWGHAAYPLVGHRGHALRAVAAVAYARVRTVTEFYRKDRLLSAEIEALDRDLACPDALASFAAAAPMDDFDAFFALA